MTSTHLHAHQRKTLNSLFQHPEPHNLEWRDVRALLDHLGTVSEGHGGGYKLTIGEHHLDLARPHGKELEGTELRDLRGFLTKAGVSSSGQDGDASPLSSADDVGSHCIVLIDHHQARLFGLGGASDEAHDKRVLAPEDADGSIRRIEHKQGNDDHDGGHGKEEDAYYERVAVDLKPAERIVVFSDGKGRSSAGEYLITYLARHHPEVSKRVIATQRVDIAHLSDGEIVAAGRLLLEASE